MGSGSGKAQEPPLEGGCIDIMRDKYGEGCLLCVKDWIKNFGFPQGGSFSTQRIKELEDKLVEQEKKLRGRKKMKTKDLEGIERHKKCLQVWKAEAESRERKQCQKTLPKVNKDDVPGKPSESQLSPSSPYSPLFKAIGKVDPDLDACPPPYDSNKSKKKAVKTKQAPSTATASTSSHEPGSTSAQEGGELSDKMTLRSQMQHQAYSEISNNKSDDGDDKIPQMHTLPMIQVAGPAGPNLVFRPWTTHDIDEAAKTLPPISAGGTKLGKELLLFCKEWSPTELEIQRLLLKHMGAACYSKVKSVFQASGNRYLRRIDWEHGDNHDYVDLVTILLNKLEKEFPTKVDMTQITNCKQGPSESVEEYYHRLWGLFKHHSGLEEPDDDFKGAESMWESHFKTTFIGGLSNDVGYEVKRHCVDWQNGRLPEIIRHARHAEKNYTTSKTKKTENDQAQLHLAQLTMLQAVTTSQQQPQPRANRRGRGRGRARGRGRGNRSPLARDQCYICRRMGHWAPQCPQRDQQQGQSQNAGYFHQTSD